MLFIMLMDVLTALVTRAQDHGLLQPLMPRPIGHRMSIYADDVVLFTSPSSSELSFVKAMLGKFGEAD